MTALEAGTHNPRLSIDLSSGKIQARRLSKSIERLPDIGASAAGSPLKTAMRPPVSANVDAPLIGSSPMLERAIGLMHGRHTQEMHDRHVAALHAICRESPDGFYLHDCGSIEILLGGAARQLRAGHLEYEPAVCELLDVLGNPMRSARASDVGRYEAPMAALIRTASSLLRVGIAPVSLCAAHMLLRLVAGTGPVAGTRPVAGTVAGTGPVAAAAGGTWKRTWPAPGGGTGTFPSVGLGSPASSPRSSSPAAADRTLLSPRRAQQMVAISGAVQNLVAILVPSSAVTDAALTLVALRALRQLSRHPANALQVIRAEHAVSLVGLLSQPLGSPGLSLTVDILWYALDAGAAETAGLLCRPPAVRLLTNLFSRACASNSEADKELRNEVLVLATKIAQAVDAAGREVLLDTAGGGLLHSVLAVVARDVLHFLPAGDTAGGGADDPLQALSRAVGYVTAELPPVPMSCAEPVPSRLQFELIELAMHLMQVLTASDVPTSGIRTLLDAQLPCILEAYLSPAADRRWRTADVSELRRLSIALLCNLAPLMPSADQLLPALEACLPLLQEARHPELREGALRLLVDTLTSEPGLAYPLAEAGLVPALTALLFPPAALSPTVRSTSAREMAGQDAPLCAASTQDALLLLSLVCDAVPGAAEEFGTEGGVGLLLPYLSTRGAAAADARLMIAAVDCVWSAVVPCEANVARLVERDGVTLLLNCLAAAPFTPRAHLLSCLADLLIDPAAGEQADGWRAPDGRTCAKLFVDFWREEEARLAGAASADGLLLSVERPLSVKREGAISALNASLRLPEIGAGAQAGSAHEDDGAIGGAPQVLALGPVHCSVLSFRSLDSAYATDDATGGWPGIAGETVDGARVNDPDTDAGDSLPLDGSALAMRTMTAMRISGRFVGLSGAGQAGSAEADALAGHDLRAKLYACLAAVGLNPAPDGLDPADLVLLEAIKAFSVLCDAEAWRDIQTSLMEGPARTHRPVTADAARLTDTLSELHKTTGSVLERQHQLAARLLDGPARAEDAQLLATVCALRDGPVAPHAAVRKKTPDFKERMEAKSKVSSMVAGSKVAFVGPMPDADDYATAAIDTLKESIASRAPFTRAQAEVALRDVATAAGAPIGAVEAVLARLGTGVANAPPAAAPLQPSLPTNGTDNPTDGTGTPVDETGALIDEAELRRLCVSLVAGVRA